MTELKLFKLTETVDNDKYFVKSFTSDFYMVNVIRNKEFDYKNIEVSKLGTSNFGIPHIYASFDNDKGTCILEVQTTSYGSLNENQFKSFIETQNEVLKYIPEIRQIIETE